jgi:hypothetical protein
MITLNTLNNTDMNNAWASIPSVLTYRVNHINNAKMKDMTQVELVVRWCKVVKKLQDWTGRNYSKDWYNDPVYLGYTGMISQVEYYLSEYHETVIPWDVSDMIA